jgi:hypothetical protein
MKSAGNLARLSINVSHDLAFGNKTTALPTRLMNTSLPGKRNSFGHHGRIVKLPEVKLLSRPTASESRWTQNRVPLRARFPDRSWISGPDRAPRAGPGRLAMEVFAFEPIAGIRQWQARILGDPQNRLGGGGLI